MENKSNEKKKDAKTPKIEEKNGLNITYDKEELHKYYPHLIDEISDKKKIININSVEMDIEQNSHEEITIKNNIIPNELINPSAIDFIRRCTTNKQAFEILDYLLKRNEISSEEYDTLKNKILEDGGLKDLIEKSGGHKEPGYYLNKYYKKEIKNEQLNTKKN